MKTTEATNATAAGGTPLERHVRPGAEVKAMTYADWLKSLTVEQRYNFDAEGRGYKKDASLMMRLAWEAGAAAERERCARVCEDIDAQYVREGLPSWALEDAAKAIRWPNAKLSGPNGPQAKQR